MRLVSAFMLVLVFGGIGLFAGHNSSTTDVSFLYWSWTGVPVWAPAAASSVIVLFVGSVYAAAGGITWRWRCRRLERAAESLQAGRVSSDGAASPAPVPNDPWVGDPGAQPGTSGLVPVRSRAPATPASIPTDPWAADLRERSE